MLRRFLHRSPRAEELLRSELVAAPTTIVLEVLNGLVTQTRFAGLPRELATGFFEAFRSLDLDLVPTEALAAETIELAAELNLSAYDASYVALAARLDATLATADRDLAAAYPRAELVD